MNVRRIKGKVVSDKMQKTVVVKIDILKRHSIYGKPIKMNKRLKARDDLGAKTGAEVVVEECAPFSKEVTWKVVEIINQPEEKTVKAKDVKKKGVKGE